MRAWLRRLRTWHRRRQLDRILADMDVPPGMHRVFSGSVEITSEDYDPERLADEFLEPRAHTEDDAR